MTSCSSRAIRSRSARTASRVTSSCALLEQLLLLGEPPGDPAEDVRRRRAARARTSTSVRSWCAQVDRDVVGEDQRAAPAPRRPARGGRAASGPARTAATATDQDRHRPARRAAARPTASPAGPAAAPRARRPAAGAAPAPAARRRPPRAATPTPSRSAASASSSTTPSTRQRGGQQHVPPGRRRPDRRHGRISEATAGRRPLSVEPGVETGSPPARGRRRPPSAPSVDRIGTDADRSGGSDVRVGRSAQRRIGRFAWVMAWVGLVVGQLHALARHQTADGKGDLDLWTTRVWAEPAGPRAVARCWTGATRTSSTSPTARSGCRCSSAFTLCAFVVHRRRRSRPGSRSGRGGSRSPATSWACVAVLRRLLDRSGTDDDERAADHRVPRRRCPGCC